MCYPFLDAEYPEVFCERHPVCGIAGWRAGEGGGMARLYRALMKLDIKGGMKSGALQPPHTVTICPAAECQHAYF